MRLTIIKDDGSVYKDGNSYSGLTLPSVPSDVHALQWNGATGWIEFVDSVKPNEDITSLPTWADDSLAEWQTVYDAEQAAIKAAKDAQVAKANATA